MFALRRSPPARRCQLQVEELESRSLLSLPPTAVEQLFLEQLNDARANPAAYGASIGLDLSGVAASQPLAFNTNLIESARLHSQDMNNRDFFDHDNPDGLSPGQRITNAGFNWTSWGESLAGGSAFPTTASALRALIVDAGVPDLGHRRHLLAIDGGFRNHSQVGVGILQNGSGFYRNYYTIDSGTSFDPRPFLTGVVFRDLNGNTRYDVGEGLGNVTITVTGAGGGSTTTFGSGGYSLQLNPGTYTVTMTGGGLAAPVVRTVGLGLTNQRLNIAASTITSLSPTSHFYVTGTDAGVAPHVRVLDAATRFEIFGLTPYDANFRGGVRVATGDVNGDGVPDIITAPGPGGGPHVRVFDGSTGGALVGPLGNFFAYHPSFSGGVFVAAGDTNADGRADIITGAGAGGGPHVQVFSGANGSLLRGFFAYNPAFTAGVYVAAGDTDGDGRADIITGTGAGGDPLVHVFSGGTGALLRGFHAYALAFRGGVRVAVADRTGDGYADILTAAGPGGGPHVRLFDGLSGAEIESLFAYDPFQTAGVFVGGR